MKAWVVGRYESSRFQGLPGAARSFPPAVQRYFGTISGYELADFVLRLTGDGPSDVLVVGPGAGRDSFWLAAHGHHVTNIDITHQPSLARFAIADMAALPFTDASFDRIVVSDVLEHTFADRQSVLEFRRTLRPSGAIILNVPFGDDAGEHHVRVYSEATLRRLLSSCGLSIEKKVYRGVLPLLEQRIPAWPVLFHGINLAVHLMRGAPAYQRWLPAMAEFDWRRGDRVFFRRLSRVHGAYLRIRRAEDFIDYGVVNKKEYRDQAEKMLESSELRRKAVGR